MYSFLKQAANWLYRSKQSEDVASEIEKDQNDYENDLSVQL
jgi:hypothetical protein